MEELWGMLQNAINKIKAISSPPAPNDNSNNNPRSTSSDPVISRAEANWRITTKVKGQISLLFQRFWGETVKYSKGKDGESILKVKQSGSAFGLQVLLNVHRQEYYGVISYQTGFKILIHHQGTPPMVSQLSFAVGPGTSTFAAIRKQRVLNLPNPYESNCFNETVSSIPGYPEYTISSCMLICQTKFVNEKCGCREVGMPDINNTKVCDLYQAAVCLEKEKKNFYELKDYQCDCPVPCDSITFKPSLSYAAFPSTNYVSTAFKIINPSDASSMTPEVLKLAEELMSQNNLLLNIYFQDLNYQLMQETPAYVSESLLAEIGGQVGLCVGASLLTVLEFIDVIFCMIKIRLGFR